MTTPCAALRGELSLVMCDAVSALFAAMEIPMTHDASIEPRRALWVDPVAVIGFSGHEMAGSLVLSAPWPMMAAINPVGDHAREGLADWSRELSNMALGTVKGRLADRGVRLQIGLPMSVVSSDLRLATTSPGAVGHRFVHRGWPLIVSLDAAVSPSLRLGPCPAAGPDEAAPRVVCF